MKWPHVTKKRPCVICGRPEPQHDSCWCSYSPDGSAAICAFIESPKQQKDGRYMHKTGDAKGGSVVRSNPEFDPKVDWKKLQKIYRSNLNGHLSSVAESLGVTCDSLDSLGMGWDGMACTFPMRNANGETVGIRRRFEDGKKKAVHGSREGLFFADLCDGMFVCEGPTDAASLLSIGIVPIGRPHCLGGASEIEIIAKSHRIDAVITDNDPPGTRGANALAKRIDVRVIHPPDEFKDVRAWINGGAKKDDIVR